MDKNVFINNAENEDIGYKEIVLHISSLIESGKLKLGQQLPGERTLADSLNVGRSKIRIALKFLEFIGLVNIKVGKGAYISDDINNLAYVHLLDLLDIMKDDPFGDLLEARKTIETKMAELAAENATPEDIKDIKNALKEMERDIKEKNNLIHSANKFHFKIFKASKNAVLFKIGVLLHKLNHESRDIMLKGRDEQLMSLKEHREIFAAIKDRDSKKVANLMEEHLTWVEERVTEGLKKQYKEI